MQGNVELDIEDWCTYGVVGDVAPTPKKTYTQRLAVRTIKLASKHWGLVGMKTPDKWAKAKRYVRAARAKGKSDGDIKWALVESGWTQEAITKLWSSLGSADGASQDDQDSHATGSTATLTKPRQVSDWAVDDGQSDHPRSQYAGDANTNAPSKRKPAAADTRSRRPRPPIRPTRSQSSGGRSLGMLVVLSVLGFIGMLLVVVLLAEYWPYVLAAAAIVIVIWFSLIPSPSHTCDSCGIKASLSVFQETGRCPHCGSDRWW